MMRVTAMLGLVALVAATVKDDSALCPDTVTVPQCQAIISQCAPLAGLLAPLYGTPDTILACSNTTAIPLSPKFYVSLGKAMATGDTSALDGKLAADPASNLALRKCALNAAGLLSADGGLDLDGVGVRVSLLAPPDLGAAVYEAATTTCPPLPPTLKLKEYVKCVKRACVKALAPPPAD